MEREVGLTLTEIERRHPNEWVLVEETAWDKQGNPTRGIVRMHSVRREDLSASVKEIHREPRAKVFVFYTGEKIPENLTVVL